MATQEHVSREFGTVEENELRLDVEKSEQIIDALNQDLADTYVLYHQVKKHHWNVAGAEFRDLHLFLGDAAANLEDGADELAERAQALGGTPISGPASRPNTRPSSTRVRTSTTSVPRWNTTSTCTATSSSPRGTTSNWRRTWATTQPRRFSESSWCRSKKTPTTSSTTSKTTRW